MTDQLTPREQAEPEVPPTRPRALLAFVVPVVAAAVVGLVAGSEPGLVLGLLLGAGLFVVMAVRLDWAVHLVVAAACFDDWLLAVSPWSTKALAVVLVVSWLLRRAWGTPAAAGRRPVLVVAGGFAAVLGLSALLSWNGSLGLEVLGRYAGFLVVLLIVCDSFGAGVAPRAVARTFVVAATVAAACGLLVLALGTPEDRRVVGPIGDPNDLAFVLLAAIALVPALRATSRSTVRYDLALGLLVLATLGTLSRGAMVGLVVMFVAAVALRVISLRAAFALVVAAGTVATLVLAVVPGTVTTMVEWKGKVSGENVDQRVELWQAASAMTVDHPVLGVGPGGFVLNQDDYLPTSVVDGSIDLDVVHNTYLEVAAETGLLGLTVWLALVVTGMGLAWLRWRHDRDWLAGGVLVGLLGLSAASVFVTEQYALPIWLLLALATGRALPPGAARRALAARAPDAGRGGPPAPVDGEE